MAWVRVPPENHPIFHDALPKDPRIETMKMFGGIAPRAPALAGARVQSSREAPAQDQGAEEGREREEEDRRAREEEDGGREEEVTRPGSL